MQSAPSKWHDYPDRQISENPDAPAFSDSAGEDWSYSKLGDAISDLAQVLIQAGVAPGDRVLVLSENCCPTIAALFACSRIGACVMPVNARLTEAEITRILDFTTPAAVLFTTSVSPDARQHAQRLQAQAIKGSFGDMHLSRHSESNPDSDLADVAVMLFTTGTTGTPKGVMLTHGNLCFGGRSSADLRHITASDIIYGALPITHVFGLASVVTAATYAGASVRLEARFNARRAFGALQHGITLFSAVPQMHALLMQHAREQGEEVLDRCVLRYTSSGAAPLDPDWKRRAEAFYGVALQNGYGLTECTAGVCITSSEIGDPDISVGRPFPEVEVQLDETVSGGGKGLGEVMTRGPHVMQGYYRKPDETAAVFQDGWFRTGDLGRFDDKGRLHIAGRCKELIIHGGFNVYPPEVEAALNVHPDVVQTAVVGRSRAGDEEVLAFVQLASAGTATARELREFAGGQLAGYKKPSQVVIVESLPAAPTGKILKHELLKVFGDRLD